MNQKKQIMLHLTFQGELAEKLSEEKDAVETIHRALVEYFKSAPKKVIVDEEEKD